MSNITENFNMHQIVFTFLILNHYFNTARVISIHRQLETEHVCIIEI